MPTAAAAFTSLCWTRSTLKHNEKLLDGIGWVDATHSRVC